MHQQSSVSVSPRRWNAKNAIAGAFFIAVGTAFGAVALLKLDLGTALQMGPGYFPLILSGLMVALGLAILVAKPDVQSDNPVHPLPWRGIVLIGAAPLIFATAVGPLGLAPAIALTVAAVSYASRKATFKLAVSITVGVTLLCIAVFKVGLGIPAPIFGSLLGG